jgi:hypothetical protein
MSAPNGEGRAIGDEIDHKDRAAIRNAAPVETKGAFRVTELTDLMARSCRRSRPFHSPVGSLQLLHSIDQPSGGYPS